MCESLCQSACPFFTLINDAKFQNALMNSVIFWFAGLLLLGLSYVVIDRIFFPKIHIGDELRKGNMAVAIVIAAFIGGISLIIFGVTN